MSLVIAGVNHRTAPIEVREKLAFSSSEQTAVLSQLRSNPSVGEAALLSTCNRTEAYVIDADDSVVTQIRDLFTERLGENAAPYLYVRHDRETAAHLFKVTAGLDSMILGEAQIQGQVQDAW